MATPKRARKTRGILPHQTQETASRFGGFPDLSSYGRNELRPIQWAFIGIQLGTSVEADQPFRRRTSSSLMVAGFR